MGTGEEGLGEALRLESWEVTELARGIDDSAGYVSIRGRGKE
jgi:hypothetical protein